MKEINELINIGHRLQSQNLVWGTSGNISSLLQNGEVLISASGTRVGDLKEDSFVQCELESGEVLKGTEKASKETFMHTYIYQNRKDVKAVLHCSPYYATMVACSDLEIKPNLFIESMYYLEDIAYVDYHHPGTKELAEAVAEKSKDAAVIIMRNHGVVVCGDSLEDAYMRLETLEIICRMVLDEKKSDITLNEINDEKVFDFLNNSHYKPRKK